MLKSGSIILLSVFMTFCSPSWGQPKADDRLIFDEYIRYIKDSSDTSRRSMADLIIATARFFLGKPYAASTLEKEPERLVVNLREFDCTTFVETTLALSRMVEKSEHPSFKDFCEQLRRIRYRNGVVDDYTSRLHYFTDWIYENAKNGSIHDVTQKAGGKPYRPDLYFMSSHPERYPQLRSDSGFTETLRKKEREISERNVYSMIAERDIADSEVFLQDGDIVCFVAGIGGLDVTHVGFIYRRHDGNLTFIHASSMAKKVIINPQPVRKYVKQSRYTRGLMIVRPREVE
jgi:cell wall-associated NlpC family hydrolase